jgi:hypothetical protein
MECGTCREFMLYDDFCDYNTGDGAMGQTSGTDLVTVTDIYGYLDPEGKFVFEPWYSYLAPPGAKTANKSGEYAVCVYDSKGKKLATTWFNAADKTQATMLKGTESLPNPKIPVNVVIDHPESGAKIAVEKDGKEVYSRTVTKNAPEVKFVGLSENQSLQNKATIKWEAGDKDGDELSFALYYCLSNGEYYVLGHNITGRSLDVDLTEYPGSDEAYFYIYATDGVRTAETYSPYVSVPYVAPKFLTELAEPLKGKITEEILLPVEVWDAQDGWLCTGSQVSWALGGEEISITDTFHSWPFQFEPGVHTLTCTATNSAGQSVSKDYKIEVVNDLSGLPNDWSREEIISALTLGYTTPVGRLDSPLARGELADFMMYLWVYADTAELPQYDESLIKDCNPDDTDTMYSTSMMAALGLMDAPGGYFEPAKAVTQREAMLIMFKTSMLAFYPDVTIGDIKTTEEEVLAIFMERGIFDAEGENAYRPDEKLSKKLGLVRMYRLHASTFPEA